MTDEQLQSLFAGVERHLDRRADAIEQRVDQRIAGVEQRIVGVEQRLAATEQRILTEVDTKIEALETKLLGEFWKWARAVEARMRMHDAINAATLERLGSMEERVLNLEKPPQQH